MMIELYLGTFGGVKVYSKVDSSVDSVLQVDLKYLSPEIKKEILEEKDKERGGALTQWTYKEPMKFIISKEEYKRLISFKYGIICNRSIDNEKYLESLLQSLNINQLKDLCRHYKIKNFSKLTKQELIKHILISLSAEEQEEALYHLEPEIINREVAKALRIIHQKEKEKISAIKFLHDSEVEITFKGWDWEITTFLYITEENIANPERDCDCMIGSNQGFCPHFWVAFLYLLKKGVFSLEGWKLTVIPSAIKGNLSNLPEIREV